MGDLENWKLNELPLPIDVETKSVLKALPSAHAALAELKGMASTIPNQNILINTIGLQEAKDSSAIENIIITHDDLFKSGLSIGAFNSLEAKEVQNYITALKKGFEIVQERKLITNSTILEIQKKIEGNNAGFRKLPGTALKNVDTGETVYTPPQDPAEITCLMSNLEKFVNDPSVSDYDPLIKMAIIHYQFESIHPFYDGNGRTGRIINILYLILQNLQTLPILYLSSFIIQRKSEYYKLLQQIRNEASWEEWLLFMIEGVEQTAKETIDIITQIKELMMTIKQKLRNNYKFYSQDLLNNIFIHPYTKIEFVVNDLQVSRITAANYLNKLANDGLLVKQRIGTGNYYINEPLFNLLAKR
ncbi:MAG: Fic family protein [Bacteroidetes bacterium]|jgi:Fic family protein|nr:Fic family protein [Bacteroidota bacterium]MBT3751743.1 Fic family protein [Bacteroidota bacterium]MBT4408792.1 Fic family protein [Bacteroidota bacterium]MBT7464726.1 Fic family protein [Bacteroidota bacterium]